MIESPAHGWSHQPDLSPAGRPLARGNAVRPRRCRRHGPSPPAHGRCRRAARGWLDRLCPSGALLPASPRQATGSWHPRGSPPWPGTDRPVPGRVLPRGSPATPPADCLPCVHRDRGRGRRWSEPRPRWPRARLPARPHGPLAQGSAPRATYLERPARHGAGREATFPRRTIAWSDRHSHSPGVAARDRRRQPNRWVEKS